MVLWSSFLFLSYSRFGVLLDSVDTHMYKVKHPFVVLLNQAEFLDEPLILEVGFKSSQLLLLLGLAGFGVEVGPGSVVLFVKNLIFKLILQLFDQPLLLMWRRAILGPFDELVQSTLFVDVGHPIGILLVPHRLVLPAATWSPVGCQFLEGSERLLWSASQDH
jgi:hypothetical protein